MEFADIPVMDRETAEILHDALAEAGLDSLALPMPTVEPPIVTLCGSTRFRKAFEDAACMFALMDSIVLTVGTFPERNQDGSYLWLTEEQKFDLDRLHFAKIERSNFVFVLNVDGYIGRSTAREIVFANLCKLPVFWHDRKRILANYRDLLDIANEKKVWSPTMDTVEDNEPYPWDGLLEHNFGITIGDK